MKTQAQQELWLTFRNEDGEVICIESENGTITRYITEKSTVGKSLKAFGADLPPQKINGYSQRTIEIVQAAKEAKKDLYHIDNEPIGNV